MATQREFVENTIPSREDADAIVWRLQLGPDRSVAVIRHRAETIGLPGSFVATATWLGEFRHSCITTHDHPDRKTAAKAALRQALHLSCERNSPDEYDFS